MLSDEEWKKAPDWDYINKNKKYLKTKCDCPDSCEKRVVGCAYGGGKEYQCRNCGCVYFVDELRPIRLPGKQFGTHIVTK